MTTVPIWRATTPDGHNLFDAMSALQKCVRRGLEEDAIYWAKEMYLSEYPGSLWQRLKVIASEDVGLADPQAVLLVAALMRNAKEVSKANQRGQEERSDRMFAIHAVLILVRAQKSRVVDTATIHAFEGGSAKRAVPDFALDARTQQGKRMGRTEEYFWRESAKLTNAAPIPDPYETSARTLRVAARDSQRLFE